MLYWFLKLLMNIAFRAFFKRVYMAGLENIPADKPVILASNHPNSFLDAIALGTLLRRPVHFLARGDVFNTPFKKWLLWQIKMIPIYRLEEGIENLSKNQETFDKCSRILKKRGMVLIFSEGLCIIEKRLRKLRKGTARIAFSTEESNQWKLDLQIIPVGLNYTHPTQLRKELMITMGEAIPVAQFRQQYEENQAVAIRQFNEKLSEQLQKLVIHVADKQHDLLAEQVSEIIRGQENTAWLPWLKKGDSRRRMEFDAIQRLNSMEAAPLGRLKFMTEGYCTELKKLGIHDAQVARIPGNSVLHLLALLISFPFALIGYFNNIWPWQAASSLTKKAVKSNVFQASVLVGLAFFLFIFWYVLLFFVGKAMPTPINYILWSAPLSGYVSLLWKDGFKQWLSVNRWNSLSHEQQAEFIKQREAILHLFA